MKLYQNRANKVEISAKKNTLGQKKKKKKTLFHKPRLLKVEIMGQKSLLNSPSRMGGVEIMGSLSIGRHDSEVGRFGTDNIMFEYSMAEFF